MKWPLDVSCSVVTVTILVTMTKRYHEVREVFRLDLGLDN